MSKTALLTAFVVSVAAGQVQAPADEQSFKVVDINPATTRSGAQQVQFTGGTLRISNSTVKDMLPMAFFRRPDVFRGGPAWIGQDRFDITAGTRSTATEAVLSLLVLNMLKNEFGLIFHEEPCQTRGFVLSVARPSPNLTPSKPGTPGCRRGLSSTDCTAIKMSDFVARLPFIAPDYVDRTIVDETHLDGEFDFHLTWSPRSQADAGEGRSLSVAMKEDLGLALDSRTVTASCIVIDGATKPAFH